MSTLRQYALPHTSRLRLQLCWMSSYRSLGVRPMPGRHSVAEWPVKRHVPLLGTTLLVVDAGGPKGGHHTGRASILVPRCAGSMPSTPAMGSMHDYGRPRVRIDVLVALVITPDQIARLRRVETMCEGCQAVAPLDT